mmetsp:Transcript_54505/g.124187  ORF Transcript_54505/g.124187 Transcript_54505/m.124187 type:complete len:225 (+) Transcript_54505:140-814(+)
MKLRGARIWPRMPRGVTQQMGVVEALLSLVLALPPHLKLLRERDAKRLHLIVSFRRSNEKLVRGKKTLRSERQQRPLMSKGIRWLGHKRLETVPTETNRQIHPARSPRRRGGSGGSSGVTRQNLKAMAMGRPFLSTHLPRRLLRPKGPRLHLSDENPVASFDWWRGSPSTWHSKRLHNVMPLRRQVSRVTAVVELAMVHKFPLHFQHPSASPKRYIQRSIRELR